jgi:hypothetical protein
VSWRVRRALDGGWLVDDGLPQSRVRRLRRGEPLPEDTSALPTVERLFECSNADRGTYKTQHHKLVGEPAEAPPNGAPAPKVLRPWAPAGTAWEVVPAHTMQPPGLEYRLELGTDGQRYARWPAAKVSDIVIFDEDDDS